MEGSVATAIRRFDICAVAQQQRDEPRVPQRRRPEQRGLAALVRSIDSGARPEQHPCHCFVAVSARKDQGCVSVSVGAPAQQRCVVHERRYAHLIAVSRRGPQRLGGSSLQSGAGRERRRDKRRLPGCAAWRNIST